MVGMDLSLAEQFVLLAHKPTGGRVLAADYSGAAELGDLTLWRRVEFVGVKIRLLDVTPTGIAWLDGGIGLLRQYAGSRNKPVPAYKYIRDRSPVGSPSTSALAMHRSSLAQRDYLRCVRKRALGVIPRKRYYPNPAIWNAVLGDLRAFARGELQPDGRLTLLAALVHSTGLAQSLPLANPERGQLKAISNNTALGVAVRGVINSQ
ncbi:GOLPH3/VPS74 family protein [Saccharopolyspora sp. NPDC003752]